MEGNNYQPNDQNDQYYSQPNPQEQYQNPNYNYQYPMPPVEQKANVGLAILSFLIPIAGLIIFLVEKDKKPKTAKASGICALISFIINIILTIVVWVAYFAGVTGMSNAAQDVFADSDFSYYEEFDAEEPSDDGTVYVQDGNLGNFVCNVKESVITTDYEGNPALVVTYEFTNNSDEASSFDLSISDTAFQNGVSLEMAFMDDLEYEDKQIKPGVTIDVQKAYVLNDTENSVEIELSELFNMDSATSVTVIELV